MSNGTRHAGPVIVLLAIVVALSALAVGFACIGPKNWITLGFELVVLLTSLLAAGWGFALWRVRNDTRDDAGFSLALVCFGGSILLASFLGGIGDRSYLGWFGEPLFRVPVPSVTVEGYPLLLARAAVAGVMCVLAAIGVLFRQPKRSLPRLLIGIALAGVLVVMLGVAWYFRSNIAQMSGLMRATVGVIAFTLFTALAAASFHLQVRAFEVADESS